MPLWALVSLAVLLATLTIPALGWKRNRDS
jgi:hypothetical protein